MSSDASICSAVMHSGGASRIMLPFRAEGKGARKLCGEGDRGGEGEGGQGRGEGEVAPQVSAVATAVFFAVTLLLDPQEHEPRKSGWAVRGVATLILRTHIHVVPLRPSITKSFTQFSANELRERGRKTHKDTRTGYVDTAAPLPKYAPWVGFARSPFSFSSRHMSHAFVPSPRSSWPIDRSMPMRYGTRKRHNGMEQNGRRERQSPKLGQRDYCGRDAGGVRASVDRHTEGARRTSHKHTEEQNKNKKKNETLRDRDSSIELKQDALHF